MFPGDYPDHIFPLRDIPNAPGTHHSSVHVCREIRSSRIEQWAYRVFRCHRGSWGLKGNELYPLPHFTGHPPYTPQSSASCRRTSSTSAAPVPAPAPFRRSRPASPIRPVTAHGGRTGRLRWPQRRSHSHPCDRESVSVLAVGVARPKGSAGQVSNSKHGAWALDAMYSS